MGDKQGMGTWIIWGQHLKKMKWLALGVDSGGGRHEGVMGSKENHALSVFFFPFERDSSVLGLLWQEPRWESDNEDMRERTELIIEKGCNWLTTSWRKRRYQKSTPRKRRRFVFIWEEGSLLEWDLKERDKDGCGFQQGQPFALPPWHALINLNQTSIDILHSRRTVWLSQGLRSRGFFLVSCSSLPCFFHLGLYDQGQTLHLFKC